MIITTNKDFSAWTEIFEDPVLVTAMLDRLLHHSHVFALKGDSYRIKHRLTPA
jgi:DNA replication protein DnaC